MSKSLAMHELEELIRVSFRLNRPEFSVFVDYSGHVNMVSVRCFPKGWANDSVTTESWYAYCSGNLYSPGNISHITRAIERLWKHRNKKPADAEKIARKGICSVESCAKPVFAAKLCTTHYQRKRRERMASQGEAQSQPTDSQR